MGPRGKEKKAGGTKRIMKMKERESERQGKDGRRERKIDKERKRGSKDESVCVGEREREIKRKMVIERRGPFQHKVLMTWSVFRNDTFDCLNPLGASRWSFGSNFIPLYFLPKALFPLLLFLNPFQPVPIPSASLSILLHII